MNFLQAAHSFRPFSHPNTIGGWCMLGPTVIAHSDNIENFYDKQFRKAAVEAEMDRQNNAPSYLPCHIFGIDARSLFRNDWFVCGNKSGCISKPERESPVPYGLGAIVEFYPIFTPSTSRSFYVSAVHHYTYPNGIVSVGYDLVGETRAAEGVGDIILHVEHASVSLVSPVTQESFEKMIKALAIALKEE